MTARSTGQDPSDPLDIAIIGAGIAGLSAARALMDAGISPVIFDKGRGIGGRVATRRVTLQAGAALQFDHGAQFATAKGAGFASALDRLRASGHAAVWDTRLEGSARSQIIGVPAMSALARGLGQGAQVVQNAAVLALQQMGTQWRIAMGDGTSVYARRVLLTVPAPQLGALLGADHPLALGVQHVQMQPCLTLMVAARGPAAPFTAQRLPDDDRAWIAQDSTKAGRSTAGYTTWVAQAGLRFSTQHLEKSAEEMAAIMLPLLRARVGIGAQDVVYSAAHRWRYARVGTPLGRAFLRDADGGLYIGGDWCLGARIEAAWDSGAAMAADLLAQL
jgi:predicted NAD/FAD-dependent oxidoreductase